MTVRKLKSQQLSKLRVLLIAAIVALFFFSSGVTVALANASPDQPLIAINGKNLTGKVITIGSPFVRVDLSYVMPSNHQFEGIVLYKGHSCSLASQRESITWCDSTSCQIGRYHDFDITFESGAKFYHVFDQSPRLVHFSIELQTKDPYGAVMSTCYDRTVQLNPCDKILEASYGQNESRTVTFEFVDSVTLQPLSGVEILLSAGPVPHLVELNNGAIEMRTVPRNKIRFSFARDINNRFAVGPFENQFSKNGLRRIKVALCDKLNDG